MNPAAVKKQGTEGLLGDAIDALPSFVLRGFDLNVSLLGGNRNESSDGVGKPFDSLHDLGQGCALGTPNHLEDLGSLALGAWSGGLSGGGRLRGFFCGIGLPRRGALTFGTLSGCLGRVRAL